MGTTSLNEEMTRNSSKRVVNIKNNLLPVLYCTLLNLQALASQQIKAWWKAFAFMMNQNADKQPPVLTLSLA